MFCCINPPVAELETVWSENKNSIFQYLKQANTGVRGVVQFEDGTAAKRVTVKIDSRDPSFKTNEDGEFFRILLPGKYGLSVAFNCDEIYRTAIEIPQNSRLLEINITLSNSYKNSLKAIALNPSSIFCSSSTRVEAHLYLLLLVLSSQILIASKNTFG